MANKVEVDRLIKKNKDLILQGTILSIDPASGGGESKPGYAYFVNGELRFSGTINTDAPTLQGRLSQIRIYLEDKFAYVDVLVTEDIRIIRGRFSGQGAYNLLKGVGAVLASVDCDICLEITPLEWKRKLQVGYTKSDENDAIYLGKYLISRAGAKDSTIADEKATSMAKSRKAPSSRRVDLNWNTNKIQSKKNGVKAPKKKGKKKCATKSKSKLVAKAKKAKKPIAQKRKSPTKIS